MKDYTVDELNHALNQWVRGRNAKRNREIFRMSFIDGVPQEQIAEQFDMRDRKSVV